MALTRTVRRRFVCGPVHLHLHAPDDAWLEQLAPLLNVYDAPWPDDDATVDITAEIDDADAPPPDVAGDYLRCARYRVDRRGHELVAAAMTGAWAAFDVNARSARIHAPPAGDDELVREDLEQLLLLLLTVGWRDTGWTPLHVGSIVRDGRCALICASSGGGKSTFVASMVRRGWKTLGDDKILARRDGPRIALAALSTGMNLDPAAARWFPEVGDLAAQAPYSRWTAKRKLRLDDVWPGCRTDRAQPTHVLILQRGGEPGTITAQPVDVIQVTDALARQVVLPHDPGAARSILGTVAGIAGAASGVRVTVGDNAPAHDQAMRRVEEALA